MFNLFKMNRLTNKRIVKKSKNYTIKYFVCQTSYNFKQNKQYINKNFNNIAKFIKKFKKKLVKKRY